MEEGTSPAFLQLLREVIWVYRKYPYLCLCLAWVLEYYVSQLPHVGDYVFVKSSCVHACEESESKRAYVL